MPSTSLKSAAIFISTRTHKRDTGWLAGKCKVRKSVCFCLSVVVVVVVPPKNVHREIATTLIQFTGSFQVDGNGLFVGAHANNHVATSFTASNDRHGSTNDIIFHKLVEAHALELSV